jgi:hypothetical protein
VYWWTIKLIGWLIDCNLTVYRPLSGINITLTILQHNSCTTRLFVISTFSVTWLGTVDIHVIFALLVLNLIKCALLILDNNWLIIWMITTSGLSRFLGSPPWWSSWIVGWIVNKTILWNVLHQRIIVGIIGRIYYGASVRSLTDLIMMLWSFNLNLLKLFM